MNQLEIFVHVRPGFESEAFEELTSVLYGDCSTGHQKIGPQADFKEGVGFVRLPLILNAKDAIAKLSIEQLIFPRQIYFGIGVLQLNDEQDRISLVSNAIVNDLLPQVDANAFSGFTVETPDEDVAKELSQFCKSLSKPLENRLNKLRLLPKGPGARKLPRLVLVLTDRHHVWIGVAKESWSSPWPKGILRLKFPHDAPSRSTLKLEEAFLTFLTPDEQTLYLKAGMTAVDLGASPGGWTYQFVKRGISVIAVDNGSMDHSLLTSGLVVHKQEDALHFTPPETVDWMVCDVVEKPAMMAKVAARWIREGLCRRCIINLKLPMSQRLLEVKKCLAIIEEDASNKKQLDRQKNSLTIRCKQLFHDRKEVTVFVNAFSST